MKCLVRFAFILIINRHTYSDAALLFQCWIPTNNPFSHPLMINVVVGQPRSGMAMSPHRRHPPHPYWTFPDDPLDPALSGRRRSPLPPYQTVDTVNWITRPPPPANIGDWAESADNPGERVRPSNTAREWVGPYNTLGEQVGPSNTVSERAEISDALSEWTERSSEWAKSSSTPAEWAGPPPTSGELERLFFAALSRAFPLHFSTRLLIPTRRSGRTRITNAHVLVRGCPPGTSYCGLFGGWSEVGGYSGGPIVRTLDELVPFLKARSIADMAEARGFLAEAVVVRQEELRPQSGSYRQHVHMLHVMQGTLSHLGRLLQWLSQRDAPAWVPTAIDTSTSHSMDYTALTRR